MLLSQKIGHIYTCRSGIHAQWDVSFLHGSDHYNLLVCACFFVDSMKKCIKVSKKCMTTFRYQLLTFGIVGIGKLLDSIIILYIKIMYVDSDTHNAF